jgi:bifunctional DNase/RNase
MDRWDFLVVVVVSVSAASGLLLHEAVRDEVYFSNESYVAVENVEATGEILRFETDCFRLPMRVSKSQAESIRAGKSGFEYARPSTHGMVEDVLRGTDTELRRVHIYGLENRVFRAYLEFESGALVDVRPSDAAAVAVRTGDPVYVKSSLLRDVGVATCGV